MTEQKWLTVTEAAEQLQFISRPTLNRYLREWWVNRDDMFPDGEVIRLLGKRGQFRVTEQALLHFTDWLSNNRDDVSD